MKRPKQAIMRYSKIPTEISSYTCPHCHVNFTGAGIRRNVTRFLCSECGNEIIIIGRKDIGDE
jgi:peptide subunit release factor 1 (eRF1)